MTSEQDANRTVCAVCGGQLAAGYATIPFVRGDRVVTIREVPAEVCGDCGEAYMTGTVVDHIQKLVTAFEALDAEVSVAHYRAA
jgi:YgiT-type zinc finger domain-containing protein